MTIQGSILLTWTHLGQGLAWLLVGLIATSYTNKRGIYIALLVPLVYGLFVEGILFRPGIGIPTALLDADLNDFVTKLLIPFFAAVIGGLLGELIRPSTGD